MTNGEVVFEAPWQGRVFGMARTLAAAGVFQWEEFRACLIEELALAEAAGGQADPAPFAYYDHFLRALERVLAERRIVSAELVGERSAAFEARPHGHDHAGAGHHHGDR